MAEGTHETHEFHRLDDKYHDMDKRLFKLEGDVVRHDSFLVDFAAELKSLPDKLASKMTEMMDSRFQIHKAEMCLPNHVIGSGSNKDKEKATFYEWIIRALIGIITAAISAVVMYYGKGGS